MLSTFLIVFFAAFTGSALGAGSIVFFAKISDAAQVPAKIIGSIAEGAADGLRKGVTKSS